MHKISSNPHWLPSGCKQFNWEIHRFRVFNSVLPLLQFGWEWLKLFGAKLGHEFCLPLIDIDILKLKYIDIPIIKWYIIYAIHKWVKIWNNKKWKYKHISMAWGYLLTIFLRHSFFIGIDSIFKHTHVLRRSTCSTEQELPLKVVRIHFSK